MLAFSISSILMHQKSNRFSSAVEKFPILTGTKNRRFLNAVEKSLKNSVEFLERKNLRFLQAMIFRACKKLKIFYKL
jgi:hypothetical protein